MELRARDAHKVVVFVRFADCRAGFGWESDTKAIRSWKEVR